MSQTHADAHRVTTTSGPQRLLSIIFPLHHHIIILYDCHITTFSSLSIPNKSLLIAFIHQSQALPQHIASIRLVSLTNQRLNFPLHSVRVCVCVWVRAVCVFTEHVGEVNCHRNRSVCLSLLVLCGLKRS